MKRGTVASPSVHKESGARLRVENLCVRYGGVLAVADVTISTPAKGVIGLIGPNGAGKSSLANAICGVVRTSSGRVLLDGLDITRDPVYRRARNGLRRTFQNLELFDSFTVEETLRVSAGGSPKHWTGVEDDQGPDGRINWVSQLLGLSEYRSALVNELPYGLKKMVELGRAFIAKPRLVVLDEPVAGLDSKEKKAAASQIQRIATEASSAVLLIEHDMATVRDLCDHVYVMDMGKVIASGSFQEVVSEDRVREAYLGQDWADQK